MILNDNIKFIINKYLTYSEDQINEFKEEFKKKIKRINRLFNNNLINYHDECYVCDNPDHFNFECPKFYGEVHNINSRVLK